MLDQKTINAICDHAAVSDLAKVNWQGRGKAPIGFIKGMAATYGLCLQMLAAKDSAALAMVRIVDGPGEHDVFDHYDQKTADVGLSIIGDVNRLRTLFVILVGLGMRESSGGIDIGRDTSANNVTAETAEGGTWQQSYDSRKASPEIDKLLKTYQRSPIDDIFQEGVKLRRGALDNFGEGPGRAFQATAKHCPVFAAQCAAIGLRTLYTHWGPIDRREVEIRPEAIALFRQVEDIVGAPAPGVPVAEALIGVFAGLSGQKGETKPTVDPPALDLPSRIVAAMRKRNFKFSALGAVGEVNVVYVEGMGPDGTKNDNAPNQFNDARFVIGFDGTKPKILGAWEATTEPSRRWTEDPMNPKGAARIKFGQYTAWQVGSHHGHEALVQTGGPVTVCRDLNKDYKRDGDKEDTGSFGINQHAGYDLPKGDLGTSSAGCLVGRMFVGHREFMALVKSDPRYIANNRFVFTAAVLPASEI